MKHRDFAPCHSIDFCSFQLGVRLRDLNGHLHHNSSRRLGVLQRIVIDCVYIRAAGAEGRSCTTGMT